MMRNIYFEGELGEKFGTKFQVNAGTVRDVFKLVECNHPSFRKYLLDCHEDDIGFEIDVADNKLDYGEEMFMKLGKGDITVTPIPSGSKSAGAKILAALAIITVMVVTGGGAGIGALGSTATVGNAGIVGTVATGATGTTSLFTTVTAAGTIGLSTTGMMTGMMALNLGIAGLTQMMAPDPATDSDQESSYLFNGAQQNIVQGDPVPVLYGMLRVPGQPISFEVAGVNTRISTFGFDPFGNSYNTATKSGDS